MELGKLEYISAREVWKHEADDFTPWLFENADRLADALGIDLEFKTPEHAVGDFSLDLLGRDITHDAVLIVENQLESTDHTHLGQLLTYLAGTSASTVVWVATRFREEHRQALAWLNENTGKDTRFFGVEIAVARIGESSPAPVLRVVAQPNDWQKYVKAVTAAGETSGKGSAYVQFWQKLTDKVRELHPDWTRRSSSVSANWIGMSSAFRGAWINSSFANQARLRHELYIDCGDRDRNKAFLNGLLGLQPELEGVYGRTLVFEELPESGLSHFECGSSLTSGGC